MPETDKEYYDRLHAELENSPEWPEIRDKLYGVDQ